MNNISNAAIFAVIALTVAIIGLVMAVKNRNKDKKKSG
jgi:glucose uptake protein GlcU